MLKMFVSDIDGTLMDRQKKILDEDIQAIREASRRGVEIVLASGRMYEEIKVVMDLLGVSGYSICQNGATIVGLDGTIIQSNTFDKGLALGVLETARLSGHVTVICSAEGNYVREMNPAARQVGERFLTPLRENERIEAAIREGFPITKFSIYGEAALLEQLLSQLTDEFSTQVTASFSDPDGIDVMPGGVDKGVGVNKLMKLIGIQHDEVACIGDSFNDLAMFRVTPHSFAMAHASEAVKREASATAETVEKALHALLY